jgi:Fe-S cluster biogenesis protein NfuA
LSESAAMNLKTRVMAALAQEVGPALQMDGGSVEVVDVSDGIVRVRLHNVCNGCPSTIMSVIMGLEQELRRVVPEVEYLEAVY